MEQTYGAVMDDRCSSFSPGGGRMHSAPVTKVEIVIIDKGVAWALQGGNYKIAAQKSTDIYTQGILIIAEQRGFSGHVENMKGFL